jgi:hypothetical protein
MGYGNDLHISFLDISFQLLHFISRDIWWTQFSKSIFITVWDLMNVMTLIIYLFNKLEFLWENFQIFVFDF